jgi:hypothetical protein
MRISDWAAVAAVVILLWPNVRGDEPQPGKKVEPSYGSKTMGQYSASLFWSGCESVIQSRRWSCRQRERSRLGFEKTGLCQGFHVGPLFLAAGGDPSFCRT